MWPCSRCGEDRPLSGQHSLFLSWVYPPGSSELVLWCALCVKETGAKRFRRKGWGRTDKGRRLALARGLPVEKIKRSEIGRRDKWICGICKEPVDPNAPNLDSKTGKNNGEHPSLDHIVPVVHPHFPGHIKSNVQISHRKCNQAKGCEVPV